MKKSKQGYQQGKYQLLKNQNRALGKMLRYAEAIADLIYKGF